jgi:hypothetical protein
MSASEAAAYRELRLMHEIGVRRVRMMRAGAWPPPKGWADDLLGV